MEGCGDSMPNYKIFNNNTDPVYSKITNGNDNLILENGAAVSIETPSEKIDTGNSYVANNYFASVGNNSFANVHIKAGSSKAPHAQMFVVSDGKCYISLYRGATYSNSGTTLTILNRNGDSSNTTQSTAYYSPTISNSGALLYQTLLPGAKGSAAVGGETMSQSEAILKYSTDYLLKVQNKSGGNSNIAIEIDYYEI